MKFPYKLIDLTHSLTSAIPTWDMSCGFEHSIHHDYDPTAEFKFRTHTINMSEGVGTHMDSPAHCFAEGKTIDELLLSDLLAPCVVIDISGKANEGYSLSVQDVLDFEKKHGTIAAGSFAMVRTGWERFWPEPAKYHNNHHFPSVWKDAAELLLTRGAVGIGIDTLSPDRPDDGFHTHKLFLGAEKFIVENACNLAALPATGSFIIPVPIKIKGGTEAPIRLIGLVKT